MLALVASAKTNSAPLHALLIVFASLAIAVLGLFVVTGGLAARNKKGRLKLLTALRERPAKAIVAGLAEQILPPSAEITGAADAVVAPSTSIAPSPAAHERSAAARRLVANLTTGDLVINSDLAHQGQLLSEQDTSTSVASESNARGGRSAGGRL